VPENHDSLPAEGAITVTRTESAIFTYRTPRGARLQAGTTRGSASPSPYGELMARTGSTDTPYTFCGRHGVYWEGGALYHMKARYYRADIARFISPDPLGISGGGNLYAYANGDPIRFLDALGLCAQSGNRSVELGLSATALIVRGEVHIGAARNNDGSAVGIYFGASGGWALGAGMSPSLVVGDDPDTQLSTGFDPIWSTDGGGSFVTGGFRFNGDSSRPARYIGVQPPTEAGASSTIGFEGSLEIPLGPGVTAEDVGEIRREIGDSIRAIETGRWWGL